MYRPLPLVAIVLSAAVLLIAGWRVDPPPVRFAHTTHLDVECMDCHHNWAEPYGLLSGASCQGCHHGQPELRQRLEADFHRLCRSCHAATPSSASGHPAPVARCSHCHAGPSRWSGQ